VDFLLETGLVATPANRVVFERIRSWTNGCLLKVHCQSLIGWFAQLPMLIIWGLAVNSCHQLCS